MPPIIACAIACIALLGWATGIEILTRGIPVSNTVNPLTSLMLILASGGMLAHLASSPRYLARLSAVVVIVVPAIVLGSIVFGWNGALDTFLFQGVPARMAPMTATSLALVGAGILLLEAGPRFALAAQIVALAVLVAPLVVIVGYLEGLTDLVAIGRTAPMAILTALALIALGVGLMLAEPELGFMAPLASGPAAVIAARLMPAAFLVPIGLDWLRRYGVAAGWFYPAYGNALPVLGGIGLLSAMVWWTAHKVALAESLRGEKEILAANSAQLALLARELSAARDRAEQADQAKSRFLAHISHELRTPLNGILGYAQMMQMETEADPAKAARISAILGAGRHLLQMINSVLDFSQIEADQIDLSIVDTDIVAVCQACLDVVRPAAEAKALRLREENAVGTFCRLATDDTRLRQVVLNLLQNAIKFTNTGEITLRLSLTPAKTLRLSVTDTGPGIPDTQKSRLFESFERLETESSRGGAGLGLAISAKLIKRMGGTIGCDRGPGGQGCVFWIELPDEVAISAPDPATPAPATLPFPRQLSILVVDDVDMNQAVAAAALRAAGHRVVCVDSGEKAVHEAATGVFDVVLMDVRMPVMDGLEATRRIRALGGDQARVPIVAVTAHAFAEQVTDCRKAGMDGHLSKPFDFESLLKTVQSAVGACN
jgi:signal transduction histidine kinase/ActR/RegA family two-component response regulator